MNTSEKIMTVIMVLLLPILAFAVMKHNKAAQPLPQVERVEKPCPDGNCPTPNDEVVGNTDEPVKPMPKKRIFKGRDEAGNPGDETPGYQPPPEKKIFKGRIKQRFGY